MSNNIYYIKNSIGSIVTEVSATSEEGALVKYAHSHDLTYVQVTFFGYTAVKINSVKLQNIFNTFESYEEFLNVLKTEVIKLSNENPDFIYNPTNEVVSCRYNQPAEIYDNKEKKFIQVGPNCNGCIIGQALQRMGWSDEEEIQCIFRLNLLLKYISVPIPDKLFKLVTSIIDVQKKQDSGYSWGNAIKELL